MPAPVDIEIPQRVLDRVFSYFDVRGEDDCWPCKLKPAKNGYCSISWAVPNSWALYGKNLTTHVLAHRAVWIVTYGPIRGQLTVDHECRNTLCGNPRHLRLKTHSDNARDNWVANKNAAKQYCLHWHPYTKRNTVWAKRKGGSQTRKCRVCANRYDRKRYREGRHVA